MSKKIKSKKLNVLLNCREPLSLVDLLEASGHEAWFVGGCVRDALLGRPIADIDIATAAPWEEAARICRNAGLHVRESGVKHGTITVLGAGSQGQGAAAEMPADAPADLAAIQGGIEVTTFRTDGAYTDARHPDSVEFVRTIEEDLARRDFTINAMAWHPVRGLLDPYDGKKDLKRARIRAVGKPKQRFKEDALRILRACRFAAQLGFTIAPKTFAAMVANKSLLTRVSIERTTHELDLLLTAPYAGEALLATIDVLAVPLPELVAMRDCPQITKYHCYDVLGHTAAALQAAEPPTRLVRWATLCHDMGKPSTAFFDKEGVEHFYGHPRVSTEIAEGICNRFQMSRQFKADVLKLVRAHDDEIHATHKSIRRTLSRLDGRVDLFRALLAVKRADILASAPKYRASVDYVVEIELILQDILSADEAFSMRALAIGGDDIIALGLTPGPMVGELLQISLDAVIDELLPNDRDALLSFIRGIINS